MLREGMLREGMLREGMLSSRCILNMKRLVTLKHKQMKTSMQVKKAT